MIGPGDYVDEDDVPEPRSLIDQRDLEGADGRDLARARFLNYLDASKDVDDET